MPWTIKAVDKTAAAMIVSRVSARVVGRRVLEDRRSVESVAIAPGEFCSCVYQGSWKD